MGEGTERTKGVIDNLTIDDDIGMADIKGFIEELWNCTSRFLEGIKERLIELGYSEEEISDNENCFKIVLSFFKKHSIPVPTKLKDWIKNSDLPGYGDQSKPNIYRLCFALEMNAEQTINFFKRSYFDTPFNWKKIDEVVYYFCLKYNKPYSEAEKIIEDLSLDNDNPQYIHKKIVEGLLSDSGVTQLIGNDIDQLETTEALLQYISDHKNSDVKIRETVKIEIEGLLKKIKNHDQLKSDNLVLETILGYNPKKNIKNDKPIKYEDFPKCITDHWPKNITLSQIRNNKDSYATRKMLILLNFYNFFTSKTDETKEYSQEFFTDMNTLLLKCNFNELYWRNPFDLLFYYAAISYDPFDAFVYLIEEMLKKV